MTTAHLTKAGLHGRKLEGLKRDLTLGPKEIPAEVQRSAARTIALVATDHDDCRLLLDMLGLLEVAS